MAGQVKLQHRHILQNKIVSSIWQDEQHNKSKINADKLNQGYFSCDAVIASSYSLEPDFANNFINGFMKTDASIFAVQFSKDDGTMFGRLNWRCIGCATGIVVVIFKNRVKILRMYKQV